MAIRSKLIGEVSHYLIGSKFNIPTSPMSTEISLLLPQSQSAKRVERVRAIALLQQTLVTSESEASNPHILSDVSSFISETLNSNLNNTPWENIHGVLLITEMLAQIDKINYDLVELYLAKFNTLIQSKEVTVRNETAKLLDVLSKVYGSRCFAQLHDSVLSVAERYFSVSTLAQESPAINCSISPKHDPYSEDPEYDAKTWKYLEACLESIRYTAKGCNECAKGPREFDMFVNTRLINLIEKTCRHPNRFIRESTFNIVSLIVEQPSTDSAEADTVRACMKWKSTLVDCIYVGLSDDWSQVRMSGCIACRHFFINLPKKDWSEFFPTLLPPLCLNRYYEATGVQTYSCETWRIITEGNGQHLVETHLEAILHFYLSQSVSENHAVRTAVLHCIGELGRKIPSELIESYQEDIAACLMRTIKDPCWPVREATCYCYTALIPLFPTKYLSLIKDLLPSLLEVLGDFIPSTRQSAAFALSDLAKVYQDKVLDGIFVEVKRRITQVQEQKAVPVYDDPAIHAAFYGVVKCQELVVPGEKEVSAPSAPSVNSLSQPWMRTDGCVYLLAELSQNPIAHSRIVEIIPLLSEAVRIRHYSQHIQLFETICRALPLIAKGVGKKVFKPQLHLFIEMLFYSLEHPNIATARAAKESLIELVQFLGRDIMRLRIENFDQLLLPKFDDVCTSIQ